MTLADIRAFLAAPEAWREIQRAAGGQIPASIAAYCNERARNLAQILALEASEQLAGCSESMTEAVVPPAVAVVGSLDPHTGRKT